MDASARYRYLNAAGEWPGFARRGLDSGPAGELRLAALPAPIGPLPEDLAGRAAPDGPAGVAVGPDGTVYWTDPATNSLWRAGGCERRPMVVNCVGGAGSGATNFDTPRAVLAHPGHARVYVADTGNGRVLGFDARTWQLVAVWDGFDSPTGLAWDADGFVYVADRGAGTVRKRDADGDHVAELAGPPTWRPVAVAVASDPDGNERVYVLDAAAKAVTVFTTGGAAVATHPLGDIAPAGLAAVGRGELLVGDHAGRRVRKYRPDGNGGLEAVGDAQYDGPVAGLAADGCGGLLVLAGADRPFRLALDGGRVGAGRVWGATGPVPPLGPVYWVRLKALGYLPTRGAAVRLFVRRSASASPTGDPPEPDWSTARDLAELHASAGAGTAGEWYAAPRGAAECLFPVAHGDRLAVGVELTSGGTATPVLEQLRLDFQYEGLFRRLPDCYADAPPAGGFAARLVGLFGSLFEDADGAIGALPARFDPAATPDPAALARLVGLDPRDDAPDREVREAVRGAVARHAARGTAAAVADAVRREVGVRAVVEEPVRFTSVWVLPDGCGAEPGGDGVGAVLGRSTGLAAGDPAGAVVGAALTLDRSSLLTADEWGRPLFGNAANRVVVRVPACPARGAEYLRRVREVLDRELPCHVGYELCVVEPRLRLGVQARLGVDAVLGGPDPPVPLGQPPAVVLGGDAPALGGATLGTDTYLG